MASCDGAVVKNCTGAVVTTIVKGGVPLESVTTTLAVPPTVFATDPIVKSEPVAEAVTRAGLLLVAV